MKRVPLPPRPNVPTALLGGLTPAEFLRRHWQREPLVVRAALPGLEPVVSRADLFRLAARPDVESRLVVRSGNRWTLEHGPLARKALPGVRRRGWTLLVQGVDAHDDDAHALLQSFRFVPDARLDDLMISWASDGGGVGPHVDDYDVFLLQARGRRRWSIAREPKLEFRSDAPLKVLKRFAADEEHVLEPGDMLYLPPGWGHDGIAVGGDCITYSIGFRAPRRGDVAVEIVERLTEGYEDDAIYRDAGLAATDRPARVPHDLAEFASGAVERLLAQPGGIERALGEALTAPKPAVSFDEPVREWTGGAVVLDRGTRMMYDGARLYVNGESLRVSAREAKVLRRLANERALDARAVRDAGRVVRATLARWHARGWLRDATD